MRTRTKAFFWIFCVSILFIFAMIQVSATKDKLAAIGQKHLLQFWDTLPIADREKLSEQIDQLDDFQFIAQRNAIIQPEAQTSEVLTPFHDYIKSGSEENMALGKQLIADGKVGCLIVAGGQGTRLQCTGPKGIFPVTLVKQKSLFQFFAERVLAASKQANRPLFVAIMTSPVNHTETVNFFEKNHYFGLDKNQIAFFSQEELPLLDNQGNLFLETPSKISAGPDGNAASLKFFVKSGIWSAWHNQGVRYLNYVHIDNPLADPFDAELTGFHHSQQGDVIIKCVPRKDPLEKVGVIGKKNGKVNVIEYSEISPAERDAMDQDGTLKHLCCNISIFSFDMDFVKNVASQYYNKLPFHKAWKAVKYVTPEGVTKLADEPMAWKFEKFIFDVLPFANSVSALLYPRSECFAPLKNVNGTDSINDVQATLQCYDRAAFAKVSETPIAVSKAFELDPQFYYPTQELLAKWKGKPLPDTSYIEP